MSRRKQLGLVLSGEETPVDIGWGERWARERGLVPFAGVDEVGRGCLAGPVVAAAVVLPETLEATLVAEGLTDSKRLSRERREYFASRLRAEARVGVGTVDAARIDETDILRATFEAMTLAVHAVVAGGVALRCLLVDGNQPIRPEPLAGVPQKTLVKGDSRAACIAAASVVAKVHRDGLMRGWHEAWPDYGFEGNKGYPSPDHQAALERLGPCPIHRRSFAGVQGRREAETADLPLFGRKVGT